MIDMEKYFSTLILLLLQNDFDALYNKNSMFIIVH